MTTDPLTRALQQGSRLIVLSPHLDDAALSCGALLAQASRTAPVTVVTFFTEAGPPPHTLSAMRYLHQVGERDAARHYAARRAEDIHVMTHLAVDWRHLGLTEGLFRRRPATTPVRSRLHRALPECGHIYPTYRLHLARGRIADQDEATLHAATAAVARLAAEGPALFLAPLAVGGHADHLIVRQAAAAAADHAVYYSDFPYNQAEPADPAFVRTHHLQPCAPLRTAEPKEALVRGYRTQVPALFPDGRIPEVPEVYLHTAPAYAHQLTAGGAR
ncbi:LmbE family N-acetylglucosaminyl deacetylase [Kitasatospora sp. MAA4]|uniref:PIG-L family deacetylase n=1 Tax=Kitasatospora sp. MAA4 TaxID=3035093 RepID=UPI002474A830|nr:PIG-L family deacetylase [Kitasatospora sp. MAA4]MDH6137103.1 LmbE family N-acetylglucosaminyl deacetylase [Kitasatospora sp. MAA4]